MYTQKQRPHKPKMNWNGTTELLNCDIWRVSLLLLKSKLSAYKEKKKKEYLPRNFKEETDGQATHFGTDLFVAKVLGLLPGT